MRISPVPRFVIGNVYTKVFFALANLSMGHHEKVWLQNFGLTEVLFYRRYVDDTFCLFHSEADAVQFFHYLNSRHNNIRFTMEKESENRLPFLDVLIDNNQVPVLTTVFRKSTFTGLLMNFTSFTSSSYKLGLIRTLIDRAYKINSTWLGFHQETTKIKAFLLKNSYPAHIIDKAINSTINKFFQFNRQNGNNSPISIYVVGSKLQTYATRPNGSMGRSRRLLHVPNTNEV